MITSALTTTALLAEHMALQNELNQMAARGTLVYESDRVGVITAIQFEIVEEIAERELISLIGQ